MTFRVSLSAKPKAVIYDIDGTLSSAMHRSHFADSGRWSEFHGHMTQDAPIDETIGHLLTDMAAGRAIVLLSLRPERFRSATEAWLSKNHVPYDALYLRPENDYGQGYIVKRRIYEEQIAKDYDVVKAYDDYDKMLDMWKDVGIPTVVPVTDPALPADATTPPATDPRYPSGRWPATRDWTTGDSQIERDAAGSAVGRLQTKVGTVRSKDGARTVWIPPHMSVSELGKPYHVKGHFRHLAMSAMEILEKYLGRKK